MSKIPYIISIAHPDKVKPKIEFIQGSETKETFEKTIIDKILDIMLEREGNYDSFENFSESFFEESCMDNQAIVVRFYDPETDEWYNYLNKEVKDKIFEIYNKIYLAITSSYISNKIIELYNRKLETDATSVGETINTYDDLTEV